MSKAIQPRLGTAMTMIVGVLFLFLVISQAGKYHESGYIKEKAEERLALRKERKKAMLYIGVSDDLALKVPEIDIPINNSEIVARKTRNDESKLAAGNPVVNASQQGLNNVENRINSLAKSSRSKKSYYTVRNGDTLFGISQKVYGDGNKWRNILSYNKKLKNPNALKSGMKLAIPEPTSNNTAFLQWKSSKKRKKS